MSEKAFRIRTNLSNDSVVRVNVEQDIDFLEVLSIKINQTDNYKLHNSNYGIIVGRVLANDAFGVPNCRVSVFVPLDEEDSLRSEITSLYPYETVTSKDRKNIRYNLLPDTYDDECMRAVGTFPNKRLVLDNDTEIEIYDKYWKYTTVTNNAGDYMLYGVPTGSSTVHVDLDLSDIGILSQSPRDLIYKGYDPNLFDSPSQFRESTNLDSLSQIISQTQPVEVYPFWGDSSLSNVAISRCDVQIQYKFEPTCIFLGSIATDDYTSNINQKCSPSRTNGVNRALVSSEGTIEMIRKTMDGYVEEFPINANQLIDGDGVWCYQIPMNLDYIGTDEFGNIIRTDNPNKGIPTRTSVRFRFSIQETGNEGISRHRARYLVPNNPQLLSGSSVPMIEDGSRFNETYEFGSATPDECFRDLYWNKIYSVKNYVPRIQTSKSKSTRNYSGLKTTNYNEGKNPIPFNKLRLRLPFAYSLLCVICKIVIRLISFINKLICVLYKVPIIKRVVHIGCVGFNFLFDEDSTESIAYVPGCKCSRGQKNTKCPDDEKNCKKVWDTKDIIDKMEQTLGEEYRIANLDFYNDWINGCLYFPLWFWKKTKKRKFLFGLFSKKAKNVFCDCDRGFKKARIIQSCAVPYKNIKNAFKQGLILNKKDSTRNWHRDFTQKRLKYGIIKEFTNRDGLNVYYYACGIPPVSNYANRVEPVEYIRLYSTDIILLGSFNDCSFDGLPRLYANLPTTTANIPMIASIIESSSDEDIDEEENDSLEQNNGDNISFSDEGNYNGEVELTGMDWTHSGNKDGYKKGLFFDLSCVKAKTRLKTCVNVERMCELGVSMDASYDNYVSNGRELIPEHYEADGMITRYEIVDNESRAMFASMNGIGLTEKVTSENTTYDTYKMKYVYPVDFDGSMKNISKTYSRLRSHPTYDNFDASYLKFRLGNIAHYYNTSFLVYENSFYFYFGLNEGKTAIEKFYTKYYSDCFQNNKFPFTYTVSTESGKYCPSTNQDYGLITVSLGAIKTPYKYTLYDEWDEPLISEKDMYDNTLIFGASGNTDAEYVYNEDGSLVRDGALWYKNKESVQGEYTEETKYVLVNNDKKIMLANGTYKIEVTDSRERTATQTILVQPTYITMTASASGLGMKYYGYTSDGGEIYTDDTSGLTYDVMDGSLGVEGETLIDADDYIISGESKVSENVENAVSSDADTLLKDIDEFATTQSDFIYKDESGKTITTKSNNRVDEKSLICGLDKAGTIIIDDIIVDGIPCEVVYVSCKKPLTISGGVITEDETHSGKIYEVSASTNNQPKKGVAPLPDVAEFHDNDYEDGDFFVIVTNDSRQNTEGNTYYYIKLNIKPSNKDSFSACSCDFYENASGSCGYDVGYNFPESEDDSDIYGNYSSDTSAGFPSSGGIYEYGDLDTYEDVDAHINFSVWVPDDYNITLTQYCLDDVESAHTYDLTDNVSETTLTVENGGTFDLLVNEVPIRFLLGNVSGETEYNSDYFNSGATSPTELSGWFKVHMPYGYIFPTIDADNYNFWLDYVDASSQGSNDFDDEMKSRVIMYKFDSMFKMSNGVYVTNESLSNIATESRGGQKPILYMGAYPNYLYEDEMGTFIVDTIGAAEFNEVYPNIVGKNYCYKVTDKPNTAEWKKINIGRTQLKLAQGRLYNDLMMPYIGASKAFFNPEYYNNDSNTLIDKKSGFITVTDVSGYTKDVGNYLAGLTLNGGLTNTDYDGKCRPSVEYAHRTEALPVGASAFTMCAGTEYEYEKLPSEIKNHYFRYETLDRRLDYDLFFYMPMYSENGIKLQNGREMNKDSYGRLYGTVYNGIEMAYERAAKGSSGVTKYNVIGKEENDGLEYYYSMDDCNIYANLNKNVTSQNKRFYESFVKCGSKKYDITDLYYSGFHIPSKVTSITNAKTTKKTAENELVPLMLDAKPSSEFFFKQEVNGDFEINNYPTKRTVNLFGLNPTNKVKFNVTSCSYDMESGILGDEEPTVGNTQIQGGDDVNPITSSTSTYVITASTIQGEVCETTIDTRDRLTVYHEYSESDLETSYDSYEIRYRSVGGTNESTPEIIAYFNNPKDLRLRFKMKGDGYSEDHDTFTTRPMIVNILSQDGSKNFLDEAIENSSSPRDLVDNIRLNCRAQFVSIDTLPQTVKSTDDNYPSNIMPRGGKFENTYLTQINYNKYPFLVDAEAQYCDIVRDNSMDAEDTIYKYGIFSYRRKRKTRYESEWNDYFKYGRGRGFRPKVRYYHKDVASVCGVMYERTYINTNDDNLGKNIKLLKLSSAFDLRPFRIKFAGSYDDVGQYMDDNYPMSKYYILEKEYRGDNKNVVTSDYQDDRRSLSSATLSSPTYQCMQINNINAIIQPIYGSEFDGLFNGNEKKALCPENPDIKEATGVLYKYVIISSQDGGNVTQESLLDTLRADCISMASGPLSSIFSLPDENSTSTGGGYFVESITIGTSSGSARGGVYLYLDDANQSISGFYDLEKVTDTNGWSGITSETSTSNPQSINPLKSVTYYSCTLLCPFGFISQSEDIQYITVDDGIDINDVRDELSREGIGYVERYLDEENDMIDISSSSGGTIDAEYSEYGGEGGITLDLSEDISKSPYYNDWKNTVSSQTSANTFSLFSEKEDDDKPYTLDDCNVLSARLCLCKKAEFIGSRCKMYIFNQNSKNPTLRLAFQWPGNLDSEVDTDDLKTEINNYFNMGKTTDSKKAKGCALILRMKNGYYYTILFKMGWYNYTKGIIKRRRRKNRKTGGYFTGWK